MDISPRQEARAAGQSIRRAAAVRAATRLFAAHGFHATAMADVARESGLSLKALYEAFPSKEELFAGVLRDVGEHFAGLVHPGEEGTPQATIVALFERVIALCAENVEALRLYSRGVDGIPAALREQGIDPFADFTARLCATLAGLIARVQAERGTARLDPDITARALLAVMIAEMRVRVDAGQDVAAAADDLRPLVETIMRDC